MHRPDPRPLGTKRHLHLLPSVHRLHVHRRGAHARNIRHDDQVPTAATPHPLRGPGTTRNAAGRPSAQRSASPEVPALSSAVVRRTKEQVARRRAVSLEPPSFLISCRLSFSFSPRYHAQQQGGVRAPHACVLRTHRNRAFANHGPCFQL